MDRPPIITNDFLLTCLQYEYFKTNGHARQGYKNISEMMSSTEVREEVKDRKTEDGEQDEDGSEGDVPEEEMETDEAQNPVEEEEPQQEMAMDELVDQGASTSTTVKTKRKLRREESSSDGSTDRSPEVKKERLLHPKEQEHSPDEESSTSDPQSVEMRSKQSSSSDSIPIRIHKMDIHGSRGSCSDGDNSKDDDDRISISLGDDDDQKFVTVLQSTVTEFFKKFDKGFKKSDNPTTGVPLGFDLTVGQLKDISHSFAWTYILHAGTHRFDIVKSIVDFGKVKLHLSKSDTNETFKVEYWQDTDGCLVWCGEEVKFIEKFTYELLAAREWERCVKGPSRRLEFLEFDIAERTKWSPKEQHRTFFWRKIKNIEFQTKISARKLSVKCLKSRSVEDQPFNIRSLFPIYLESIQLRVWDDTYDVGTVDDGNTALHQYLSTMESSDQWMKAVRLDMETPDLDWYHPKVFTTFTKVKRATITTDDVKQFRKIIKSLAHARITEKFDKCTVTGEMDMEEFLKKYGGKCENGKYKLRGKTGKIGGTKKRVFTMRFQENKVTFHKPPLKDEDQQADAAPL